MHEIIASDDAAAPPTRRFDPRTTPAERWADNDLQFMRLLAELNATVELTPTQMTALCASMDVAPEQVHELLDRAQDAWDAYLATMP